MNKAKYNRYDFIIAGAGCAGLSLALALRNSKLLFERVLIVDADAKNRNDRTWCFWDKSDSPPYASLIARSWKKLKVISDTNLQEIKLNNYSYHLIRGIDFYAHAQAELKADARFEFVSDFILGISSLNSEAKLSCSNGVYTAPIVFNSALRNFESNEHSENLVQHFVGWKIKTSKPSFDADSMTFMDFSVEQHNDCRFVYVLPFNETEAIVEYTGFSKTNLTEKQYTAELQNYLSNTLQGASYEITEVESGIIPMYESKAINTYGNAVIAIGTAGGASKASTGFTFYFIQKHCKQIIKALENKSYQSETFTRKKRFLFYDSVLLHLLYTNKVSGKKIFTTLFKRNKSENVFDFLNEDSSLLQELSLFLTLPLVAFTKAALLKLKQSKN